MSRTVNRALLALCLVSTLSVVSSAAWSETIFMRSGGGYAFGQNDPNWTYFAGGVASPLSGAPFTSTDFFNAISGPQAVVVPPYGGAWLNQIQCDPQAQWISVNAQAGPRSAMYARNFKVETCCISQAYLSFCWASDDNIGDQLFGGPNPMGLYLNGTALPFTGGSYATQSGGAVDITPFIHCGDNQIYVYNRDAAAVVSGVMFRVIIDIVECTVKTDQSTWGAIKALYR